MTKLGWTILALVLLIGAAFLSMLSFGIADRGAGKVAFSAPSAVPVPAGTLAVPVAGVARSAIQDNWGDPREGGARLHHGTDIMAPGGTLVVAAAAGRIEKLFQSRLGGTTVYVRSPDRRWTYYYAHLAGYAPGVREGMAVKPGDPIAYVGDTGDAGPGNYHLHFGLTRMQPSEKWWQGEDVNPYPLLASGRLPG